MLGGIIELVFASPSVMADLRGEGGQSAWGCADKIVETILEIHLIWMWRLAAPTASYHNIGYE